MAGSIQDRGQRGVRYTDKTLRMSGASWLEQTGATVFFDDFLYDTLPTDRFVVTATASGTAAVSSTAGDPVAAHGGWISLDVTADADAAEIAVMAATTVGHFRPDRAGKGVLVFQLRYSRPTALTTRWENWGFTDDETEGAAIAVSLSTATWTTTASNAVLGGHYSTATNNTSTQFIGVKANADTASVSSAVTATIDTAVVGRIEIDSAGQAYFYESFGAVTSPAYQGTAGAAVTATTPLIPYVALAGTSAAAAAFEVDYILAACAR